MTTTRGHNLCKTAYKGILSWVLGALLVMMATPLFALAPDPDLNNDGVVNILDASIVGSCFGADLSALTQCVCADSDGNGVIDMVDVNFVKGAFRQSGFPVGPNACVAKHNTPPVAHAGPDQTVRVGEQVTLNGSASSDVDGDALTFTWQILSQPSGGAATLSNPTAVMPTFFANAAGAYVLQLIVNDGTVDSAPDTVTITTTN